MHWTRLTLVIVIAAVLQLVIEKYVTFAFRPDLLVIVLVFFVANTDSYWPIIAAFATGFAADLISPVLMGPDMIAFGVCGSLLAAARRWIALDNAVFVALAILLAALTTGVISQVLVSFRQSTPSGAYSALLWSSLASAVIGPYICSILLVASDLMGIKRAGRRGR